MDPTVSDHLGSASRGLGMGLAATFLGVGLMGLWGAGMALSIAFATGAAMVGVAGCIVGAIAFWALSGAVKCYRGAKEFENDVAKPRPLTRIAACIATCTMSSVLAMTVASDAKLSVSFTTAATPPQTHTITFTPVSVTVDPPLKRNEI